MKTKIVEATNGIFWGKFLISAFSDEEWGHRSHAAAGGLELSLLWACGHRTAARLIVDLTTREGAVFFPGETPDDELRRHPIRVSSLFLPFLKWLYAKGDVEVERLPDVVMLPLGTASQLAEAR